MANDGARPPRPVSPAVGKYRDPSPLFEGYDGGAWDFGGRSFDSECIRMQYEHVGMNFVNP